MNWLAQCRDWLKRYDPVRPEHFRERIEPDLHHYGFMRRLSKWIPENAIITYDTGGNAIMMGHCFRSKKGQRIFSSNGNSAMGTAMCAAIGAWFAEPTRPVICIIGDGGLQLNLQEFQTIKHYGVKIKIFCINNLFLANTALYQLQNGKKPLACGPDGYSAPDFSAIANAYGIFAAHIDNWTSCDSVLRIVMDMDEAVLCDVVHPYFCDFQPRTVLWNAGIEEQFAPLPVDEFQANMIVPPLDGWAERQKLYKPLDGWKERR